MLLRNPSWSGLSPSLPDFKIASKDIANQLLRALGLEGKVYYSHFDNTNQNHYLIHLISGERLYVKTASLSSYEHLLESEKLSKWLLDNGIKTSAAIDIKTDSINNQEKVLFVYPYILGRRVQSNVKDITLLAKSLAKLHLCLKTHPSTLKWKKRTYERYLTLEKIRKNIAEQKYQLGKATVPLEQLAKQFDFSFFFETDIAAPSHGDANPGNLLIDKDNDLYFFDFEDALYSYQPIIIELAYIIERFILTKNIDNDEMSLKLGKIFIKEYWSSGGKYYYQTQHKDLLKLLALKAFCILILCETQGIKINQSEWRKFFYLLEIAEEKQSIFNKIIS